MHHKHPYTFFLSLLFIPTFFFFALMGGHLAHAQISGSGGGAAPDPLQYILSPETPGPNALEYIEINGVGTFLGDSQITWSMNDKVVQSGVGQSTLKFMTGGVGSATHIHVDIKSPTNGSFSKDFVFAPSTVNLLWEADTSVPPLYLGKALYSAGSHVRVVAFPTIVSGRSLLGVDKLSFQWKLNGDAQPASSGLGRNVFGFDGSQLHSEEAVSVDVLFNGKKVGQADIVIPASNPQVVIYDHDALRGELLDGAFQNNLSLGQSEVTLQAQPYYFANSSVQNGNLLYAWTLGGQDANGPDSARGMLTLRQTGQGAGAAAVGVSIQNTDNSKLVQAAQNNLQITFGQAAKSLFSSLFGL
ncbi:MAG: hypothetical protein WCI89_00620 [bacterium]